MQRAVVAADYYTTYTQFSIPWEYGVIDDFLDDITINKILEIGKDESLYRLIDSRQLKNGTAANKSSILLTHYPDVLESVTNAVNKHLSGILPNPSFCVPDLVRCEPGYRYVKHKDHPDKLLSLIVYLKRDEGNGTVLWDDNNNQYEVMWKYNRVVVFENHKHGIHNYINTTNNLRYTLNIYITDDPKTSFNTKLVPKKTI